ncbi:hypothetical protein NliqN6_1893 [Naganishia liquefaciens]|uniref:SDR family NAD(P)-dependent oxidoreductase n=1 Tax=Naganishia liquefaciens TaxID=104408 RepID=A0A8H3TR87_9TREE|nr:hypothetical protein NliqN6_1893 [Naganishia liquefaciens]
MSIFTEQTSFEKAVSVSSSSRHTGKTVLVTGGASGIGRHVAMRYVQSGARVVVGDLNVLGCRQTVRSCAELNATGACFTPDESCNVTSKSSTLNLFNFAKSVFEGNPPDIVVANAGVSEVGHLDDDIVLENDIGHYPKEPRKTTLEVNLAGAILTAGIAQEMWAKAPLDGLHSQASRQRKLILISSMGGWEGIPMAALYSMAKHGLMGYWVALSAQLTKMPTKPFSCHAICPFFAATSILDTAILLALAGIPKTTPDDIAAAIEAVGMDSPSATQSDDTAVLLPDDRVPLVIRAQDFDPVSGDIYSNLAIMLNQRQPRPDQAEYRSTTVEDIRKALSHNKQFHPLQLVICAGGVLHVLNLLRIAHRSSMLQNLVFGFLQAALVSLVLAVVPKAKAAR